VQLREPHALGILDDHERGVRHVDADSITVVATKSWILPSLKRRIVSSFAA